MKTIIVGNGILALSTAYRLLKRTSANCEIVIIGKSDRAGSASLAAGAMLNSFAEIEYDSLDSDIDLYRFELSHMATRMWPDFESEILNDAGDVLPDGCKSCTGYDGENSCAQTGTYVVNNAAADDLDDANFEAILNALIEFNEPYSLVSPKDIPGYKPSQRSRAMRALLIHNEGWYNPRLFLEKLEKILRNSPCVTFIDELAHSLHADEDINNVELANGLRISGDNFVIANGAGLSKLLDASKLGVNVQKIFYGVGVSLEVALGEGHIQSKCIRTPNRGLACGIYSVPYYEGPGKSPPHILLGATNFISEKELRHGRISSIESIINAAMTQINTEFYKSELVRVNVGWRPCSSDTYPIVGKTSINNLYILSGTKRDGFHMCPVLSDFVVKQIMGQNIDPRFNWFSPERPLIRSLTRKQSIDKTIKHLMSAAYQHDFNPPMGRMEASIIQAYRDDLEKLHDKVGAIDWGIPPELVEMYRYNYIR